MKVELTANNWSPGHIYIRSYALTDRHKWAWSPVSFAFGDVSADLDMYLMHRGGRWQSTAAITSLTLLPATGPNFVTGCRFTFYGII